MISSKPTPYKTFEQNERELDKVKPLIRFLSEEVNVGIKLIEGVEMNKADLINRYLNSKPPTHTLHTSHYLNETTFLFIWTVKDG